MALAVLASLSVSVVVDAGLSVWRGSPAQRAIAVLPDRALRPAPAVVTVAPRHPHPSAPAASAPTPVVPTRPAIVRPTTRVIHPSTPVRRVVKPTAPAVTHQPLGRTPAPAVEPSAPIRALVHRVVDPAPPAVQIRGWGAVMEAFQQA